MVSRSRRTPLRAPRLTPRPRSAPRPRLTPQTAEQRPAHQPRVPPAPGSSRAPPFGNYDTVIITVSTMMGSAARDLHPDQAQSGDTGLGRHAVGSERARINSSPLAASPGVDRGSPVLSGVGQHGLQGVP